MSGSYIAGFAAICGVVVVGLDYHQQAKSSDNGMSIESYVASVSDRFGVANPFTSADARSFLPDAPAGWTRHALSQADTTVIWPDPDQAPDLSAAGGWVYTDGTESIWIEVVQNENPATNAETQELAGFAVMGGVGFGEMKAAAGQLSLSPRQIDGWIGFGDEIQISLQADASDESIRFVLATIDYDGLNDLLQSAVPSIGASVTVDAGHEADLAANMIALRNALIDLRTKAATENLDSQETVLLVNAYLELASPGTALDAAQFGSKDQEYILQSAYRTALAKLMDGEFTNPAVGGAKIVCTTKGEHKRCRAEG